MNTRAESDLKSNLWYLDNTRAVSFYRSSLLSSDSQLFSGFTSRNGGVSSGNFCSLNLGGHVGDDINLVKQNRSMVARAAGFDSDNIVTTDQVHGTNVAVVRQAVNGKIVADAMITRLRGALLMLMFADCVPVYIYDPVNQAIGLVHSGWKGTESNIVEKTFQAMSSEFGSSAQDCIAAIGPSICGVHFEIGQEVAIKFNYPAMASADTQQDRVLTYNKVTGKYLLDLKRVISDQLQSSGVLSKNIDLSEECTYSNQEEFFSHRRDGVGGAATGRMAAVMGLLPEEKFKEERYL